MWAFKDYNAVAGYPKSISSFGLPDSVEKVDAAFYDVHTHKTLFFIGDNYYRYVLSCGVRLIQGSGLSMKKF